MIRSYDCPSCGATLSFESSIAISAICPFCRSLVIRHDLNVETLGTVAQLPPDLSPLQIGTTGEFQGVGFRLAGRLRWHWDGGSWTEWFADCGTGGHVWIAETQGFYTFSKYVEQTGLPSIDSVQAGYEERIGDKLWTVVDIKTAVCVGGEGELPEIIAQDKPRRSVDLQGPHGEFATLEAGAEGTEYFEGRYAHFDEMKFGNLRAVPGWTPGADGQRIEGQSTSFSCPNCAAPVNVRVAGLTMSAVCGSCGTIIDTSDERRQILERVAEKLQGIEPLIPIGKRGTFRGKEYEVIGFVVRRDNFASWSEYLLFNPWRGFDWLVTYNGHWSFVERLLETPGQHRHLALRLPALRQLPGDGRVRAGRILLADEHVGGHRRAGFHRAAERPFARDLRGARGSHLVEGKIRRQQGRGHGVWDRIAAGADRNLSQPAESLRPALERHPPAGLPRPAARLRPADCTPAAREN